MLDAARAHEARARPQASLVSDRYNSSIIKVKNNSGTDVTRFGVMGLGDVQMTHADAPEQFFEQVYMDGEEPAVGTHDGRFCIALDFIPDGEIGRAVVTGLVQCQVTINDDAHEYATITDASVAKLSSQGTGYARILWKAGTTGDQWAIVHLEPFHAESFWAKITGNAADGTNKWKYAWTEQQRTATGWQDLSGGRTGTTTTDFAVNANEANNDGTGVQGNSIDIDGTVFDDNSDLEIQPVQGDPVVRVWAEMSSTSTLVYTFEYVNAVDGECA